MNNTSKLQSNSDKLTSVILIEIFNKLIDLESKLNSQESINERISITNERISVTNERILNHCNEEADEGEYIRKEDTATTIFTIIDLIGILGHYVKGYSLVNDGNNNIYIAHNLTGSNIDTDVQIDVTRFDEVQAGEEIVFNYNRKKIRNIYIITRTGTSDYRLKMVW